MSGDCRVNEDVRHPAQHLGKSGTRFAYSQCRHDIQQRTSVYKKHGLDRCFFTCIIVCFIMRDMPTTKPRHSVPLTDEEIVELTAVRTEGTPEHQALVDLTGQDVGSTAASLRALLMLGLRILHERMAEYSYAAEAESADDEDRAVRRALRMRLAARAASDA
jgi:hypothetical protein